MKKLTQIFAFLFFLLLFSFSLKAETNYEKALELFKENKFKESYELCKNEIDQKSDKALEASLIQLFIAEIYDNYPLGVDDYWDLINLSQLPGPYYFAFWGINYKEVLPMKKEDILDNYLKLVKSNKINGTDRALFNEVIAGLYQYKYKKSKAESYGKSIGIMNQWQAVGIFSNLSASGFNHDFGALSHPESEYEFTDVNCSKIKWYKLVEPMAHQWFHFENYFQRNNGIVYVQTFCNSEIDKDAYLRVGVSGSLKAWVNDALCLSEEEERNNGLDSYFAKVHLNKGYNRILLQIGNSELNRWNFLARLTDENGDPLNNLSYSCSYMPYKKENRPNLQNTCIYYEKYFRDLLSKDSISMLNRFCLINTLCISGKYQEALEELKSAQTIYPNSGWILHKLSDVYSELESTNNYNTNEDKLKTLLPDLPFSQKLEFKEFVDKDKYDSASEIINKTDSWGWNKEEKYLLKIRFAKMEKRIEEANKLILEANEKFPYSPNFKYSKMSMEENRKNNAYASIKEYEEYIEDNNDFQALNTLRGLYSSVGKNKEANNISLKKLEYIPNNYWNYTELAENYKENSEYEKSISYFNKALEISPNNASIYDDIGDCYNELNKKEDAISSYSTAYQLDLNNFRILEKLNRLKETKALTDYFPKPDPVKIFNESAADTFPSEASSVILLLQDNKIVYSNGASDEDNYIIIKILNKQGIDECKEFSTYGMVEKSEIIRKDGSKQKGENGYGRVVFANLQVGDAIYVNFKKHSQNFSNLGDAFWDHLSFAFKNPTKECKYYLLIDSNRKFDYKVRNAEIKPLVTKIEQYYLYEWSLKNIKQIEEEPCTPNLIDCVPFLSISSIPNWNVVAKWYNDIYTTKTKKTYETTQALNEIFPNGYKDIPELERAKKIYNYIVKNIRYTFIPFRQNGIVPQKTSHILSTKMGDCKDVSTLFVGLARLVGLKANLVLVGTASSGEAWLTLPSIDFNHAIAALYIGDKKYFIELTTDNFSFNTLSPNLVGSAALEIQPENAEIIRIPKNGIERDALNRTTEMSFVDNKLLAKTQSIKRGYVAGYARMDYAYKSPEERKQSLIASLGKDFGKFTLDDLEFSDDLKEPTDEVNYRFNVSIPNYINAVSSYYSFKPLFIDNIETSPIDNENRNYPLLVRRYISPELQEEKVIINIDDSKSIVEIPKSKNLETEFGVFDLLYKQEGQKIYVDRKLTMKKDIVMPNEYKAFKEFVTQIFKYDNESIVLQDANKAIDKKKKKTK